MSGAARLKNLLGMQLENLSSRDVVFRTCTVITAIAQMKTRCLFRRPDFFFFLLKCVVFKVGIHGHLSVSHVGDYRPYLGRHALQRRGCPV